MKYETSLGDYIMGSVCLEKGLDKEAIGYLKKIPADQFPLHDLLLSVALHNCGNAKAADRAYRRFVQLRRAPYLLSVLSRQLS